MNWQLIRLIVQQNEGNNTVRLNKLTLPILLRKTLRRLHYTFAKIASAFFLTLYFLRRLADFKIFECFICAYYYKYNCGGVIISRIADTTDVSVVKSLTCSYRMTHTLFGTCGCGWYKHISNGLKSCNWF